MSDLDLNRYQREIIRRKFMTRFGVARSIAEGFYLRVLFTDKGLRALKRMAADGCALDPERHRHLIEELAQIPGDGS